MCEICLRTPCHPRCPNAKEPKIIGRCEYCGDPIYEGYEHWVDDEGNKYDSRTCAELYYGIREVD